MKRYLCYIAIISILFGCSNEQKEDYAQLSKEAIVELPNASDSVAIAKIIKTADMRFRVKDVQQTKEKLSALIKAESGTVAELNIQSIVQETDKVPYSADSLQEITAYRKEGTLTAKIPSEKLDEFSNTIAKMAIFVDQQAMKMDDQQLNYLSNKLKIQNRAEALHTINKLATRKGTNVSTSWMIKDDYIDKKIENMSIDERVKWSTITLSFYQDHTIHTSIVANDRISDYGPGFFRSLGLNIASGWNYLKILVLGLISVWPFIAIILLSFVIVKHLVKKEREKNLPVIKA
ncbi:MAG: DUF4349 domain-containing protein [Pedobacter sp.]|nr:DUF4349 domain-containing protein [Pedobacter sp.]MDQ8053643.1 DUF4349 domain-containing protein [Pedobacter sp.]